MRDRIDFIFILDRRTNPNRSGPFLNDFLFEQSVWQFLELDFLSVVGNVDERRIEFHERVNAVKNRLDILPF